MIYGNQGIPEDTCKFLTIFFFGCVLIWNFNLTRLSLTVLDFRTLSVFKSYVTTRCLPNAPQNLSKLLTSIIHAI